MVVSQPRNRPVGQRASVAPRPVPRARCASGELPPGRVTSAAGGHPRTGLAIPRAPRSGLAPVCGAERAALFDATRTTWPPPSVKSRSPGLSRLKRTCLPTSRWPHVERARSRVHGGNAQEPSRRRSGRRIRHTAAPRDYSKGEMALPQKGDAPWCYRTTSSRLARLPLLLREPRPPPCRRPERGVASTKRSPPNAARDPEGGEAR
jgi:hypothetical protein